MANQEGRTDSLTERLTRDRLEALLKKMAGTKIVVVGDAMLDVYLVGEVDRVSPEAPVPVVTVRASRHGLGGAANVAANVTALGAECRLVAVVGEDARAGAVRSELEDVHLSSDYLVVDPARPTTSKTRVVARGRWTLSGDGGVHLISNAGHVTGTDDTRWVGRIALEWRTKKEGRIP